MMRQCSVTAGWGGRDEGREVGMKGREGRESGRDYFILKRGKKERLTEAPCFRAGEPLSSPFLPSTLIG
ncbi:hypothetical protein E2C01_086973 [Portunus trituberculatus]|uniref:Uncharacterized protein n=1 Tax=Portunus trituberculatus TaxID=210409 RepID=A0A5B7J5A2_PORTR|nr:hypothetical protein [Portunus trituberculatus]